MVIIGGGYGGINVARELDDVASVVLVEPKDAFVHNVAALRALVDPAWLPRIYLPYGGLLSHGRVAADRAVKVDAGRVVLASGEELPADYLVLATGSSYPFPAKSDTDRTVDAHEKTLGTHAALAAAARVLLVGAGAVGIELAGEIKAVWPSKQVTLVDVADDVLGGPFRADLKAELRRQLAALGVQVLLGSPLRAAPPTEPGELRTFTVATQAGTGGDRRHLVPLLRGHPGQRLPGRRARGGPRGGRAHRGHADAAGRGPGPGVRDRGRIHRRPQGRGCGEPPGRDRGREHPGADRGGTGRRRPGAGARRS